jgi:hypothetical protein
MFGFLRLALLCLSFSNLSHSVQGNVTAPFAIFFLYIQPVYLGNVDRWTTCVVRVCMVA